MKTIGCQETSLPKLKKEFEGLPAPFKTKAKQAGWGEYIYLSPLYWDQELMENILLELKKDLKKIKLDAETIHIIRGLPKEREVPITTKRLEVD